MSMFQTATNRQANTALAILRVITGATFIAHGAQKLFVFGIAGVTGGFAQMGVPMPGVMAPFIAGLEFFGGIALVLGLLTRLASLGLVFDMLGAMMLVHLKNGFFMPNGYEFVLLLAGVTAALVLTGAGEFSLDAIIGRRRGEIVGSTDSRWGSRDREARNAA